MQNQNSNQSLPNVVASRPVIIVDPFSPGAGDVKVIAFLQWDFNNADGISRHVDAITSLIANAFGTTKTNKALVSHSKLNGEAGSTSNRGTTAQPPLVEPCSGGVTRNETNPKTSTNVGVGQIWEDGNPI